MDDDGARNSDADLQKELMVIAHMFVEYRNDPIMRELCRLAVKCTQERLIDGKS